MAEIDTRIPFMAFPQKNILESYYDGKKMAQESALGDHAVQGGKNELLTKYARMLARGVEGSDDPEAEFNRSRDLLGSAGMDVSKIPDWNNGGDLLVKLMGVPEGELTAFQQNISGLSPEDQKKAMRHKFLGEGGGQYRHLTPQEVDQMGLPPGSYQMGPDRKIYPIGAKRGPLVQIGADVADPYRVGTDVAPPAATGGETAVPFVADTSSIPRGDLPKEDDISASLGFKGALRGVANWADGLVGVLPYEAAAKGKSRLNTLTVETMGVLRGLSDQRMSNQLMDLFQRVIVKAGDVTVGKETAMIMLEDTRDMFRNKLPILLKIADNEQGRYAKKKVSEAAADAEYLYALSLEYDNVIAAAKNGFNDEGRLDMRAESYSPEEKAEIKRREDERAVIDDLLEKYAD